MYCLEAHNPYPDCAFLQLQAIALPSPPPPTGEFALYLTLKLERQWQSLLQGKVQLALKGVRLQLRLENAEISPLETILADFCQVRAIPSPTEPAWILDIKPGDSLLKGCLEQVQLGTVKVTKEPWYVEATLETSLSDISLTDAEGLWRHDISPNKLGILERAIARFFQQQAFHPHLCRTRLGSQAREGQETPPTPLSAPSLSQLQELIQQIYQATADDFRELAQLAALNPEKDLAGGNFLAAQLNSFAASGANLSRANFRGADLTDADLSEANLSQAKFGGADLSGAYLGNANLSHADLHRASLALANLIGADLTGANLTHANLTQTNLSGATVTEAKFGDNPGLSETMGLNLQQRGAIFNS